MGKRNTVKKRSTIAIFAVLGLLLATAALATEPGDATESRQIVIVGDDGERVVVSLDGTELTVISEDADGSSVRMVDMEQIGRLVGDALGDLDGHLAILQDLQLDMHMGNDNRLNVSWEDETFELDVNEIMVQIGEALETGLGDFDTDDWSDVHVRDRSDEDLRQELRELKAELRELRQEFRELDRDDD